MPPLTPLYIGHMGRGNSLGLFYSQWCTCWGLLMKKIECISVSCSIFQCECHLFAITSICRFYQNCWLLDLHTHKQCIFMTALPNEYANPPSAIFYSVNMASVVGSEVEIQDVGDVQIQEVEVEPIPVDMPIETVETTEETIEVQPMIALQPLPEAAHEEIVLQTSEEVVGGEHQLVYVDNMPVPAPEIEISTDYTIPTTSRKGKGSRKRQSKLVGTVDFVDTGDGEVVLDTTGVKRKWEQKQVQIKTLEGEFSVTMWASGEWYYTDDVFAFFALNMCLFTFSIFDYCCHCAYVSLSQGDMEVRMKIAQFGVPGHSGNMLVLWLPVVMKYFRQFWKSFLIVFAFVLVRCRPSWNSWAPPYFGETWRSWNHHGGRPPCWLNSVIEAPVFCKLFSCLSNT